MPIPGVLPGTKAKVIQGIVTVDPPSIGAGASANVEVSVPYLSVGDKVTVQCMDMLEAGLVPQAAAVITSGTLTIRLYNPTAGAIDGAARRWLWRAVKS
jgi:hypothetical protein